MAEKINKLNVNLKLRNKSRRDLFNGGSLIIILAAVFLLGLNIGDHNLGSNDGIKSESGGLPASLDYSSVNQVYQALKQNYDGKLTEQQLEDGLKHGLAEATNDPYTEYFTPQEAKSFNDELNNNISGIGAEIGADSSGNIQVIAPVAGTPAAKAGLQAQDIIATINGTSTSGLTPDQAVDKIRGKANTTVTIGVIRGTQSLSFTITRQNITVPSVTTKILAGNIGYMQISTFADDTASLSQKAADQFKQADVKGIILDLRDNPGGELTAAESLSGHWLKSGQTILQEKRGSTVVSTDTSSGDAELNGIPTVVLINAGSASASEITAGALHDQKDAYLIGEKSYGKGVVQQLICMADFSTPENSDSDSSQSAACPSSSGELKVTIASWYRPNGQNINHKGITPDQAVTENSNPTPTNDAQLQAAETYLAAHQ